LRQRSDATITQLDAARADYFGMSHSIRTAILCAVFLVATGASAEDTPENWLFVPVIVSALPAGVSIAALTSELELALQGSGQRALSNGDAGVLFEARHSSEPALLNDEQLMQLLRAALEERSRQLPTGQRGRTERGLRALDQLDGPVRQHLLSDPAVAARLFLACAITAHLLQLENQYVEAERQMFECEGAFPGFVLPPRVPTELRELFTRVQTAITKEPHGSLAVSSSRAGCVVRLNGIALGRTPATFEQVKPGAARLQLECEPGTGGRVHGVEVHEGENLYRIDETFDAAVHTRNGLWLGYYDDAERDQRIGSDAQIIGQVLAAEHVILAALDAEGRSVTLRVAQGNGLGTVRFSPDGYDREELSRALAQLPPISSHANRAAESIEPEVRVLKSSKAPRPAGSPDALKQVHAWPRFALGTVVGAGGLGGFTLAWALYAERQALRRSEVGSAASGGAVVAVGGLGASLLTASEYLWLPHEDATPPWAWVAGGAGVVGVGVGVGFALFGTHCEQDPRDATRHISPKCRAFTTAHSFGPLVAEHGLPLIGIPLVYAIRKWMQPAQLTLSVTRTRAAIAVGVLF
jgi:hypothetical protein